MFLALEYVSGQRLDELIGGRPLHPRRAVEIATRARRRVAALHAAGIAHGDVRPANVIVNSTGHAKLIDAGSRRSPPAACSRHRPARGSAGCRQTPSRRCGISRLKKPRVSAPTRAATCSRSAASSTRCSPVRRLSIVRRRCHRARHPAVLAAARERAGGHRAGRAQSDLRARAGQEPGQAVSERGRAGRGPSRRRLRCSTRPRRRARRESPEAGRGRRIIIGIALLAVAALVAWWAWLAIASLF